MPFKTTVDYNRLSESEKKFAFRGNTQIQNVDGIVPPAGPSAPTLPITSNLIFQFDASDNSKIFHTGNIITVWSSSQGSVPIHGVKMGSGNCILIPNSLNGLNTIELTSYTSYFDIRSADTTQYDTATIYIVSYPSSSLGYAANSSYEFTFGQNLFSELVSKDDYDVGNTDRRANRADIQIQDTWHYRSIHITSNANNTQNVYDSGSGAGMSGGSVVALNLKLSNALNAYGDYYASTGQWHGRVAEYLAYSVNHDTTDRQTIENYFKSKWGLL